MAVVGVLAVVIGTLFAVGSFVIVAETLIDVVGTLVAVDPSMEVDIIVSIVDFLSVAVTVAVVTLIELVCIIDVTSDALDEIVAPVVLDDSDKVEGIVDSS